MQTGEFTLRWAFVASTLGYTAVVLIALAIGVETRPFAIAMRFGLALLCVGGALYFIYRRVPATVPFLLYAFLALF